MTNRVAGGRAESTLSRVADVVWTRIPRIALKVSDLWGVALADGAYLRAWPIAAVSVPSGAALLGLLLGATHPEELYTYSLLVVALLTAVSGLGAGPATWALAGFIVGDALLARQGQYSRLSITPDLEGVRAIGALLVSYVLLAGLLVLIPVLSRTVRAGVGQRFAGRAQLIAGTAVMIATQAVLVLMWTQSTPFLIRPVWSYFGGTPDAPAIEPLQQRGWIIVVVACMAVGLRVWLESRAAVRVDPFALPRASGAGRARMPWPIVAVTRTAFVTFMLSGFFANPLELLIGALAAFGIFAIQLRVLPALPGYAAAMDRIPLLLRIAAVVVFTYVVGTIFVEGQVTNGTSSFIPLVIATLASLLLAAILVPSRPSGSPEPQDSGRHT